MPYNVYIFKKSKNYRELYIFDLSRYELMDNIINNYHKGKSFTHHGVVINPTDINKIQIIESDEESKKFHDIAKSKMIHSKSKKVAVMPPIPLEYYIFKELQKNGKDVTNQLIKKPPKNKKNIDLSNNIPSYLKKILSSGLVIAIVAILLTNFIILPYKNIPEFGISEKYDFNTEFFPNELKFYQLEGYSLSNFFLTISQIGEARADLFIKILESTDLRSRTYRDDQFGKDCELSFPGKDRVEMQYKFYLEEKPELENFTIYIQIGIINKEFFWHPADTTEGWCKYTKIDDHTYELVDSTI